MTEDGTRVNPMFPLGTVLLPGAVLPLHIFEDRYRAMTRVVLDGDREFGVVLIERGSEVGGGETRSDVGTVARVAQAEELPDGRWALVAVGDRRIRVVEWLADDPYPRAEIEDWPDADRSEIGTEEAYERVDGLLRTALALAGEVGMRVAPVDSPLPADPVDGSYAVTALAPFGPLDRQRLLASPGVRERFAELEAMLHERVETLRAQLRMPDG